MEAHLKRFLESCGNEYPSRAVYDAFGDIVSILYTAEDLTNPLAPLEPITNSIEEARYRDQLTAHIGKLNDPRRTLRLVHETFAKTSSTFMQALPPMGRLRVSQFFSRADARLPLVPAVDVMRNVPGVVQDILELYFSSELMERDLFARVRSALDRNANTMSGVEFPSPPSKLVLPNAYKGSDGEIVDGYLGGTPFHNLFYARIPFSIPDDPYRMEHTFILGGGGAGKSTLIQQIVLDDLAKPNPPPMVIIDPKGQLVDRISWLEAFSPEDGRLTDRLVIVDPDDSPALNMFHAADRWNRMYDDSFRHQLQSQAIRNLTYIFSSIESSLTPKQSVCFTFCVHLLFLFKGANVTTLMELLDDPAKSLSESTFRPTVERLDPTPLQFFKNDYYSTAYKETRQEVKRRLYGALSCTRNCSPCSRRRSARLICTTASNRGRLC